MKLTITLDTESSAFHDADDTWDPAPEVERILRTIPHKIDDGWVAGQLLDANGNTVGNWELGQ